MRDRFTATDVAGVELVPRAGVEPATFRLGGGRSILLSYRGSVRENDKPGFARLVFDGGAEEDRTPDLRIANATLSQLSYGPVNQAADFNRRTVTCHPRPGARELPIVGRLRAVASDGYDKFLEFVRNYDWPLSAPPLIRWSPPQNSGGQPKS